MDFEITEGISDNCGEGLSDSFESYFGDLSSFLKFDPLEKWFPDNIIESSKPEQLPSVLELDELFLNSPVTNRDIKHYTIRYNEKSTIENNFENSINAESPNSNKKINQKVKNFNLIIQNSKKTQFFSSRQKKSEKVSTSTLHENSADFSTPFKRRTYEEFINHLQQARETCELTMALRKSEIDDGEVKEYSNKKIENKLGEVVRKKRFSEVNKNDKFGVLCRYSTKSSDTSTIADSSFNKHLSIFSSNNRDSGYSSTLKSSQSPLQSKHIPFAKPPFKYAFGKNGGLGKENAEIKCFPAPNNSNTTYKVTTFSDNSSELPNNLPAMLQNTMATLHNNTPTKVNTESNSRSQNISTESSFKFTTIISNTTSSINSTTRPSNGSTITLSIEPTYKLTSEQKMRKRRERLVEELLATENSYLKHLHLCVTVSAFADFTLFTESVFDNFFK